MSTLAELAALEDSAEFTRRHIGPGPDDIAEMLKVVGAASLDEMAARTIPLGTAYSVWVGIGAVGAALVGIVWHGDPAPPVRVAFLALLLVSVVGLKATAGH